MALDGCGLVCKYVLIVFNIVFALVGIAMLGLGLWLRFSNDTRGLFEIEIISKSAFVIGVIVLIVLGSVMLFVVAFGDYGACNENRCALQVFSALLAVLAGAVIAAGVLAFVHSDEVGSQMAQFYTSMYGLYVVKADPAGFVALSIFQNLFHCCGVVGVFDTSAVKRICPKPDGLWESIAMPACPRVIANAFETKAPVVLGFFLGLGALLALAVVCSIILSAKLRHSLSSPQYIILTSPSQALATPYPGQNLVSTSYPYLDPVVTMPPIPVPEAQ